MMSSLRLFTWSAITPPMSAKSRMGNEAAKPTTPSQNAELVSLSTSQPCAMFCIQVPTLERKLPVQKSRKSRWRSARASRGSSIRVVSAESVTVPCASPETTPASARGSVGSEEMEEAVASRSPMVSAVAPLFGSASVVKVAWPCASRIMLLHSVSFLVCLKDVPEVIRLLQNICPIRESKLKRAKIAAIKLLVILSALILSSFARPNSEGWQQQSSTPNSGAGSSVQSSPASSPQPNTLPTAQQAPPPQSVPTQIFGFRDFAKQYQIDQKFLAVPSPALAEQHLKILTAQPHVAGSPEDKATADYVLKQFQAAGLETEMVKYSVWMNRPAEISVSVTAPAGVKMNGPTPEHVEGDPLPDNPKVLTAFNGSSPSGDVEAEVVYANYGRPEDFKKLEEMKVDVRGKIVIVRYGDNFRGVKSFVAEEHGAAGVIIYSDPIDDGYFKGDVYPQGPWRPETGVQRGSIQYMFKYPGDPTTPGVASVTSLPESQRVPPAQAADMPKISTTPLSSGDAQPILQNLAGPETPRDWQGALPFTYHVGPGPVKVKIHLKQNYRYWTIWNVIGKIRGTKYP